MRLFPTLSCSCWVIERARAREAQIRKCSPGICFQCVAFECLLFPSLPVLTEDLSHNFPKEQVSSQANPHQEPSACPASVLEVWTSIWRVHSPWMKATCERLPRLEYCPGTSRRLNWDRSHHYGDFFQRMWPRRLVRGRVELCSAVLLWHASPRDSGWLSVRKWNPFRVTWLQEAKGQTNPSITKLSQTMYLWVYYPLPWRHLVGPNGLVNFLFQIMWGEQWSVLFCFFGPRKKKMHTH